LNDP